MSETRARGLPRPRAARSSTRRSPLPRAVGGRRHRRPASLGQGRRAGPARLRRPRGVRRRRHRRLPLQRRPRRGDDPAAAPRRARSGAQRHHRPLPLLARAPRSRSSAGSRAVSGETITAIAMTEPGAGSDLQGIRTTAVDATATTTSSTGQKTFISNGILADLVIVVARTDPEAGPPGHQPARRRARHGGLRARPQPRQDRPARPGHRRAVLRPTSACPRRTSSARRAPGFLYLMKNLPRSGCRSPPRRPPRASGRPRPDASTTPRTHRVRQADRQVPAQPLRARRDGHRGPDRPGLRRRLRREARRRRARRRRPPRWRSGGPPSCRRSWSTRACSCTAATATCSSTRSPGPTEQPGPDDLRRHHRDPGGGVCFFKFLKEIMRPEIRRPGSSCSRNPAHPALLAVGAPRARRWAAYVASSRRSSDNTAPGSACHRIQALDR